MKALKSKRKVFLMLALLLSGGIASAQVTIKGNVYGGGRLGDVKNKRVENTVTTINNTNVIINKGVILGSVYGGGLGDITFMDEKAGLVEGNTLIDMRGGNVERSIYGGGEMGSVGTFTTFTDVTYKKITAPTQDSITVQVPETCMQGTGVAKVLISGGRVGRVDRAKLPGPDDDDDWGYVFAGGRGEVDSLTYYRTIAMAVVDSTCLEISSPNTASHTLITASAYGGCENGLVLRNTHVKLTGGQIGVGYRKVGNNDIWDSVYMEQSWTNVVEAVRNATFADNPGTYTSYFHECDAFPFGVNENGTTNYYIYDIYADSTGYNSNGGSTQGSNGHTFFGNLFGGGSGFYPFWDPVKRSAVWRRTAGRVNGNTTVEITGGHVLTSVYGGNEYTDVLGKSTVLMSGGTLGVPRDSTQIVQHPVTCYLFGAGMGDRRVWANTWNNVGSAEVKVFGNAAIFGSIFGGGEEGHVLGDVNVTVQDNVLIGTLGYSYVDGNIFGGGRGFSGEALTAGNVGGNIDIDIKDGQILGSVYGGGRMASVGTYIVDASSNHYGEMQDGAGHGYVTIDITGGTIGNNHEAKYNHKDHTYGGNVFGGSMGRIERLNGSTNPLWPYMSKVKNTKVTIKEENNKNTIIKGSVYGGSEFGFVTKDAEVDMQGGTVWSNLYGGGYGSTDFAKTAKYPYAATAAPNDSVQVTPMQRAGLVEGNTKVSLSGGWVKKSIYGGGELASVGTIINDTTLAIYKHSNEDTTFALSWPYEFIYEKNTGTATVNVTNGRVGIGGKDYMGPWNANGVPYNPVTNAILTPDQIKKAREDNGDIYGAGKGVAGDRYLMAHCANVDTAVVVITYPNDNAARPGNYKPKFPNPDHDYVSAFYEKWQDWTTDTMAYGALGCLPGAVYGGGENGHVLNNTFVTLNKGLIGHNVYGGGKGTDTYGVTLYEWEPDPQHPGQFIQGDPYPAEVTSITAGKVYNNTNVTVNGGYVVRNVYGGGNRASVGKGNYAGGPGDYQEAGYGEKWTATNATQLTGALDNSGHTYVTVNGGQIGTVKGDKDDLPTGNVFGGCRGEAAPNAPQTLSPRILYYPQFYLGYVNHTHVTIGNTVRPTPVFEGENPSPRLYGSVYGGGQDGHVRVDTKVVVNDAEIGNAYVSPEAAIALVDTANLEHFQWVDRGNVYGSGSGMGTYKDDNGQDQYSYSSGSVTQFTDVTINGGLIHRNVYGGGSLAIVGPPRIRLKYDANHEQTLAKVTVKGTIGVTSDVIGGTYTHTVGTGEQAHEVTETYTYGGQVFGGSRGMSERDEETFSTVIYSEVNLDTLKQGSTVVNTAFVPGNVYGGGEFGQVKQCTEVNMNQGTVGVIDYVHKHGVANTAPLDSIVHLCGGSVFGGGKGDTTYLARAHTIALVKDSTNVTIKGGHVLHSVYGGGELSSVGLRDYCYNPWGYPLHDTIYNDFRPKQGTTTHIDSTGVAVVNILGGQVGPAPKVDLEHGYNVTIGLNGVDGYVFGGSKGVGDDPASKFREIADVNSTIVRVNIPADADTSTNRLWGSIFGGGEDGHVLGDAKVYFMSGLMGTKGTTSYDGNIFGGGRNYSRKNHSAGRVRGNISVEMSGGQLYGSIFGGGRLGGTGIDSYGLIVADDEGENGRKYGNTSVKVKGGIVGNERLIEDFTEYSMGDVFGGGKGSSLGIDRPGYDRTSALLLSITKNTNVEISQADPNIPTIIYGTVYGGGEVANVGSCTWGYNTSGGIINVTPIRGTGLAKVKVSGGRIGIDNMRMRYDLVEGTGNYDLKYNNNIGHVFGGGQGLIADPTDNVNNPPVNGGANRLSEALAIVFDSDVTVEGGWVKGSVYGGGENGHIWWDTDVKIKGGQIGAGYYPATAGVPAKDSLYYGANQFFNPLEYITYVVNDVADGDTLAECYSWPLVKEGADANRPFDPVYVKAGQYPTDGKTWFGNVFGGGSGYYPYIRNENGVYKSYWNPDAGKVYGNTRVEITGGHILTSVYGGCEITDVEGTATVIMSGGTLGVPRRLKQIEDHPVTCYLFGAGKGDPRTSFNTKTNVAKAFVEVTGGTIYGSVFGGGEDGHVLDSAIVNIGGNAIIGTTGRSYVDGNIFGGGRGYSGIALTAGVVRGNIKVNITGGTMLGSIYGGGRLASVGTYLVEESDANYGKMMVDVNDPEHPENNASHGHVTVNISGGTIGNDYEALYHTDFNQHTVGGNVYAGAMGRITKLDGETVDPLWSRQAKVKSTDLNVSGTAVIKGNVYGGAEFGTVAEDATIEVSGGQIWRDVYGAGYGSSDATFTTGISNNPMQLAGRVYGNTDITVSGGWIKKCVYGGGEMASVGTFATTNDSIIHTTAAQLALSWPYEFNYTGNTGKATIEVTGGRLGVSGKDFMGPYRLGKTSQNVDTLIAISPATGLDLSADSIKEYRVDNGDIYGGGKGIAGSPYWEAHLANVKETDIHIHYNDTCDATPTTYKKKMGKGCITGAVYGGGENGHVNANTTILLEKGLVGHGVYGGGKGKDTYTVSSRDNTSTELYSLTAGKVYGNTNITITGGYVVRSVFGGGNLASVGKGNYIGYPIGADTPDEYEESTPSDGLGGLCTVTINGGELGMLKASDPDDVFKDNIPYGSVFGGSRGTVEATSDDLTSNVAHTGFVNNTLVTIGGTAKLLGSVFGGGQDGHVRWNTDVTVQGGEIGVEYRNPTYANQTMGIPSTLPTAQNIENYDNGLETMYWIARGNVFGGGSGIGTYEQNTVKHYSKYAGSVLGKADVKVTGGRIHRNVYGGGNLGTIGDGSNTTTDDKPTVTISGTAKVGLESDINISYDVTGGGYNNHDTTIYLSYGGNVFGAGRGFPREGLDDYCNVDSTTVIVSAGNVYGDVYGGGEDGHVLGNTDVRIQGGTIGSHGISGFDGNVYGGGKGSSYPVITGTGATADTTYHLYLTCGRVGGNTKVNMTGGSTKASIFGGGRLALTGVNAAGVFPTSEWTVAEHGNTIVNISGGVVGTDNCEELLQCDYSVGDVFGSGKGDFDYYQMVEAGRVTNTAINISGDNTVIHGNVVGGGEMAGIGWWGSDANYYANTGEATVTVNGGTIGSTGELAYTDSHGSNPNPGQWTIYENGQLIHTCTGNVFGGGQGDVDTISPAWVSMARVRETTVTINGGTIMSCVYGGGEQGAVTGNTRVVVNNGTVGSFVNTGSNSFYFGGVYGAGYGSDDPREDNSAYPNDSTNARGAYGWTPAIMAGRVYGDSRVDILGGTMLGNVYGGGERAYLGYEGNNTKGNAVVNIGKEITGGYEGNVTFAGSGSVFGSNKFKGTPFGNTTVNVYKTAHEGDPASVANLGNYYPNPLPNPVTIEWMRSLPKERQNYAIQAVYGGGDMSDYAPRWEGKIATTRIYECKENTIYEVYGGGNAASVGDASASFETSTDLIIEGGRIHHLFGGGNGLVTPANITGTANTTIYGGLIDEAYGGSNSTGYIHYINYHEYPTGTCPIVIDTVYSGGNEAEMIGEIYHSIDCENGGTYGSFYGGASNATIYGNVHCDIYGGTVSNLFGGSKGSPTRPANILKYPTHAEIEANPQNYSQEVKNFVNDPANAALLGTGGNVTLNIWGGHILENAFGGSDVNGRIQGKITVNVIDINNSCGLDLMNVYGGGQSAAYTPDLVDGKVINAPEVNVINGTVKGNVYGGGKGITAIVTANPVVNIGDTISTGPNAALHQSYVATIGYESVANGGNVYGGGNQANVVGNTNVNIMKANTTVRGNVYGGGQGANAQLSDLTLGLVQGNDTVRVSNGHIFGHVFGGGEMASVTGNTHVELSGGEIGVLGDPTGATNNGIAVRPLSGGRVYGGGQGDDLDKNFGHIQGNTYVHVSDNALIHNCVYGGGMLGSVGNGNLSNKNSGVATVVISGGEVGPLDGSSLNAYVYGGGRGKNEANGVYREFANVDSTSLIVTGGKVYGSIFGGSEDGHVLGDARIDFSGGELGTNGRTSWDGNIFGGGRNYAALSPTAGRVGGNIVVDMYGNAKMKGNIYGGGRKASVGMMADGNMYPDNDPEHGNIYVNVSGTVGEIPTDVTSNGWKVATSGSVYGGCMGDIDHADMGLVKNTYVKIKQGAQVVGSVYGGGELGSVEQNSHVNIEGGQIGLVQPGQETVFGGLVFGGGLGLPGKTYINYGNVDSAYVNISNGYIVNAVFGGGDNGHVMRSTDVTVSGGVIGKPLTIREFYVDSLANGLTHIYTGSVMGGGRGTDTIAGGLHSDTTGRVFGNANVTVTGGTIRHGVYGGGGLASVGTYNTLVNGLPSFNAGTGKTTVNVGGNAFIGPRKDDIIYPSRNPSGNELATATQMFGQALGQEVDSLTYVNIAFKYLGLNEGWVYGAGCGLASNENGTDDFNKLTFNDSTVVNISGNAQIAGVVFGGGENGRVMRSTELNISGGIIGGFPLQGPGEHTITTEESPEYAGVTLTYTNANSETYEDEFGAGRNSFRGSVFGGGKGSDTIVRANNTDEYRYSTMAGQVFGNSTVNISGGTMYGMVYGGGAISNVGKLVYYENPQTHQMTDSIVGMTDGNVNVTITGGNIGTNGLNNGNVFGGGLGRVGAPTSPLVKLSYTGNTRVEVNNGVHIPGSVYGGSANGHVWGNTHVIIDGAETKIGTEGQGTWHSNVFGGGGGTHRYKMSNGQQHHSITSGRVYGNTKVEIKGGQVLHNVYGGGALASVGHYNIYATNPANYVIGDTGNDTIIITGGTIGTNGDDNGMVYGSGRGVMKPLDNFMDSLTYAVKTAVIIGTKGAANNDYPKITGSVYGSGENGHVFAKSVVTVNSGTIGMSAAEFDTIHSDYYLQKKFPYRGNVYGAGCGSDTWDENDPLSHNPKAGLVQGETEVNINGGYISRNVYGGGAMASVGFFTWVERHKIDGTTNLDTLSWPDTLKFAYGGSARVNINGGHIGTAAATPATTGNVFGSSRGKAADRYKMAPYANVNKAYVTVDFNPDDNNRIVGSVFGSGESGHVYDSAIVTITKGLIMGSVFGGGDGTDTYRTTLLHATAGNDGHGHSWLADEPYDTLVRSVTAGKVYGNTKVTVNGGTIQHNVYGGGNLASVGKGNYSGYGEGGDIRDGITNVIINGGSIGTNGYYAQNEEVLNGFVFGSSRGTTYVNVSNDNRFNYTRDFFLGYVNEANVTVTNTDVIGSVFGGGDNGHVRLHTDVVINEGSEIGVAYDPNDGAITDDKWKYRGNVYGAGRGVDRIASTGGYCFSAGSVTRNTHVTINGGIVHHDVFGGGSLASVGPAAGRNDASLCTVDILGGTIGDATGVVHQYGGNVYGSSRGEVCAPTHPLLNMMASVKEAVVNIGKKENSTLSGDALVHGSVYGSGENGHVNTNATVNIYSGRIGDRATQLANDYCGNVFGAGSGTEMYDSNNDNTPDAYNPLAGIVKGNATINMEGGWVMRSVYGGGEMASVGIIRHNPEHGVDTTSTAYKHTDPETQLALSWPYKFIYDTLTGQIPTGIVHINITGGRVGVKGSDLDHDNGDVFGGSKGVAGNPYVVAHLANVDSTYININYTNSDATPLNYLKDLDTNPRGCIVGAVYGGGEDGHVNGDSHVTLANGLVGHNIYGGGKGKGKYNNQYVLTAGKVYGNTYVTVNNGYVMRCVYGGGNMASVGKGNYIGYGETASTHADTVAATGSGHTYVNILGGQFGYLYPQYPDSAFKDGNPYGTIFGGGRGKVVANEIDLFGYVNNTHVVIGANNTTGPRIYGSTFGGAQDGHVRWNTDIAVNSGTIGIIFGQDQVSNDPAVNGDYTLMEWRTRGNVFGGGSGANMYTVPQGPPRRNPNAGSVSGNTNVVINGGTIYHDVFGGGNMSAVGKFANGDPHPESEQGHAWVFINGGNIGHPEAAPQMYGGNVFGGANQGFVQKERVVTVNGGTVEGDVFGGSNMMQQPIDTVFLGLKTVNIRGGHIKRGVYGGSHSALEGNDTLVWSGFVNITGGEIDGNVYAAGNGGSINGSVCVMIGLEAVKHAPTYVNPMVQDPEQANIFRNVGLAPNTFATPGVIKIGGSLYGGSHHLEFDEDDHWNQYDVSGYSAIFVDGEGYDTEHDEAGATVSPYMNIEGGVFGCGEHCESGAGGREIIIRKYGHRVDDTAHPNELVQATRTLTTIQRGGMVLLDNANLKLSGLKDISNAANETKYGMLKVDLSLYVTNGSGIVLGTPAVPASGETPEIPGVPVYMDSIRQVKSLQLKENLLSYDQMGAHNNSNWYVIGIYGTSNNANKLYCIDTLEYSGQNMPILIPYPLQPAAENVIIFNDESKMWVRYHEKKPGDTQSKQYYGELKGFFRMRGDDYDPRGTESFAFARPKITSNYPSNNNDNTNDGGFLSYDYDNNYFLYDYGDVYTDNMQYPYTNVLYDRGDRTEYRMWVGPERIARNWYVDGTEGGWGRDDKNKKDHSAGLYPDKPKKTLFGMSGNNGVGVVTESNYTGNDMIYNYSYEDDNIYVVGAISEFDEAVLQNSTYVSSVPPVLPLRIYRYPGGHPMSNGLVDNGGGTAPTNPSTWGVATGSNLGPGANYGAMLEVKSGDSITLQGVVMDGLYGFTQDDKERHQIPTSFDQTAVSEPLVVLNRNSALSISDSTVLMRGYNKIDADTTWYTDVDYKSYKNGAAVHNGAGIFVDSTAMVYVKDTVTIVGNLQKKGEGTVESNVYLPTFASHLYVNGSLDAHTKIGVTSPNRNNDSRGYLYNTLSPVAEVRCGNLTTSKDVANDAWENCNFNDDQGWFFVNGNSATSKRTSFYKRKNEESERDTTLYFGWTWANVVREKPANFAYNNIDSPEDLAWLISESAGMNGQEATHFKDIDMKQTADIDLNQYVWVPIGDSVVESTVTSRTAHKTFAGNYDGQGHLISNLNIEYIGRGDSIYERQHYGLFGYVKQGSVNRTFVVSGKMNPELATAETFNVGGLVGSLENATVANSEAAVKIYCPDNEVSNNNVVVGGLVANMVSGEVHSSMAMPLIQVYANTKGIMGGLVGSATTGQINNSFVNADFSISNNNVVAGGLLGRGPASNEQSLKVRNNYVSLYEHTTFGENVKFGGIVYPTEMGYANIDSCYVMSSVSTGFEGIVVDNQPFIKNFSKTESSDKYGYMYLDNTVPYKKVGDKTYDTAMFVLLNKWVDKRNNGGHTYARWARPGLNEINGDMPVLLLSEYDVLSGGVPVSHQGGFRSMGSYADTKALQYAGPVRDNNDELGAALTRPRVNNIPDYLFIYGDVNNVITGLTNNRAKVSIHEDVSIINPGSLCDSANTYVGVTFDNSHQNGQAYSTPGMNLMDAQPLPRDWHMFSSPLSNAPLGFNYKGDNVAGSEHINSPWVSLSSEFSWLQYEGSNNDARYWMYGWDNSLSQKNTSAVGNDWRDGYFPSQTTEFGAGLIKDSDEFPSDGHKRYPYGMDLYTWTEPDYHWINFKRNGPNHWHSDGTNEHLDYKPVNGITTNVNEEELIVGKGYMGAIADETFMQSHGNLNTGEKTIMLTYTQTNTVAPRLKGWNLVGNPYHGYLDFNKLGDPDGPNGAVLSHHTNTDNGQDEDAFYVVYDADKFDGEAYTAYRYYPVHASEGGDYAGRYLHPHQGFYVKTETGGNLTFNETMLVNRYNLTEESHFRSEEQPAYPLVNLYLNSDKGCGDVTVIEFERPKWGGARKMKALSVGNGLFYAHHEDGYYAALFAQEGVDRVPLWFEAKEDDIFTMKWNLANADFHSMYLIDNIAGVQYDMLKNNTYSFEGHTKDYPSRFLIVFDLTGLDEQEDDEDHNFAFYNGSEWVVTGDGDLQFIDALGQVLAQEHISGQSHIYLPQVADGPYLFRLINNKEIKVQKVIITK